MTMSAVVSNRRAARSLALVAVLCLLLVAGVEPSAAQQRPQFRTTVEVVQMQVAVADSQGVPVQGLTREDFRLRIEGEPRDVVAAYEVDLRPERAHEQDDYVPPAGWRQFLMFFDFSFTSPRGIIRAQEAAASFVREHTHPRDLLGVATYNRISGVQLLVPFTADRQQVLDAVGTLGLARAGRIVDPAGFTVQPQYEDYIAEEMTDNDSIDAARREMVLAAVREAVIDNAKADYRRYSDAVNGYAKQLGGLGELLQATRGRKHVLLFSQGFDDKVLSGQSLDEMAQDSVAVAEGRVWEVNSETRFGSANLRSTLKESLDELRAADAVIHAMDTSGLGSTDSEETFVSRGSGRDTLNFLADGTNGSVAWNVNDLAPSLAGLARRTAQYYVVAYRRQPGDPETVDIELEVGHAGARVVSAPEILAPPPDYRQMTDAQRQLQLAEFVSKEIEEEEAMTLEARAEPFRGRDGLNRAAVLVEVPWPQLEELSAEGEDGRAELQLLGYLVDGEGRMLDLFSRTVTLNVREMRGALAGAPFRYYDLLLAPPGQYRVRLLVREKELGLTTTRDVPLQIPSFTADADVSVSGPVFVDTERPGLMVRGVDPESPAEHRAGAPLEYPFVLGEQEVTPQLFTVMSRGSSCRFLLQAHNLSRHPFTGEVQSSVRAVAVDEAGRRHDLAGLELVGRSVDGEGMASYLLEARLPEELDAGAYLLEVTLTDGISGEELERTLPFTVTDATASYQ
ncbi:MAG: VWA domain-containing protein [Acidobacteriota bacterium]